MKTVILDTATLGEDLPLDMMDSLGNVEKYKTTNSSQVRQRIHDTDIIVANKVKLTKDVLSCAENLRLICVTATGYDNVDINYCAENNIAVCNIKDYSRESVSQLTLAMAASLLLHLNVYDKYVKDSSYTKSGVHNCLIPVFHEMSTLTWGIVGLGSIGKRVASLANAFGMNVIAYSRTASDEYNMTDLDTLLKQSDVVSIHTPLTDETKNLISAEKIALIKKTAVLINVSRGAVCDENALAEAVLNNKIGGLGIDVYSVEPLPDDHPYNKLFACDNVIFTPHNGWGAYEARIRCMEEVKKNIEAFLAGDKRNRIV